jgi:hypothetical protein
MNTRKSNNRLVDAALIMALVVVCSLMRIPAHAVHSVPNSFGTVQPMYHSVSARADCAPTPIAALCSHAKYKRRGVSVATR